MYILLKRAYCGNEQDILDLAVVGKPFLVVVDVVQRICQLVVGKTVVWQILDDDVLKLVEFACYVVVVLGKGVYVVVGCLFAVKQCLDVWEQGLFLVFHVQAYVVGILVEEAQDERCQLVARCEGILQLGTDGR